ncbi:MAG: AAA family ATPase, partial [Gammaproteobacteria bacterium]
GGVEDDALVFEDHIERLKEVPGIAQRKLETISQAWREHSAIRDVMLFLQHHGVSTLFAVRIYKKYGDNAIARVEENPYTLADDFYGIGFFSADKVAQSIGFSLDSLVRIKAAIKHVLSASREQGHCYLTLPQIVTAVIELIAQNLDDRIVGLLEEMVKNKELCVREIHLEETSHIAYYARSLYYHEHSVAEQLNALKGTITIDSQRIADWVDRYSNTHQLTLSDEQKQAVIGIAKQAVSILTGGPGCGKTTTTRAIYKLFESMHKRVILAAPTGRAAQRMGEVIGQEAKTIHRLLQWKGDQFQINTNNPLKADVVIVDECSMLDIGLADAIISAMPKTCQLLLIGDADQLPSVGPGNVLQDLIASNAIPCFRLTQVFRQAQASHIIQSAHRINQGLLPHIISPFHQPNCWTRGIDCLFIDSDEATQAQLSFIHRIKRFAHDTSLLDTSASEPTTHPALDTERLYQFQCDKPIRSPYEHEFEIPRAFEHVDLEKLKHTESDLESFKAVLKNIHPWSSLHYNLTAIEVVQKLYQEWIPKYLGPDTDIQVLSPMARGTLGTFNLNLTLQKHVNPAGDDKPQLLIGQKMFRVGDRVIHKRNNYDLNVYNGDIGKITSVNTESVTCQVQFEPDNRVVTYNKEALMDLDLAYAITIHKSQGSEFSAVIIPVLTQHFKMLYRNLLYTGLTRAKRLAVFVGTRRALSVGAKNADTAKRQTALQTLLK